MQSTYYNQMQKIPENDLIFWLQGELSLNTMEMVLADKERSYSICEYRYASWNNPLELPKNKDKLLIKTLNYIRAYYGDTYLGFARRDDTRFDKLGHYILQ